MLEPGRNYSVANTNYRYGFNGKENDNDIESSMQDYGKRIYDERLGKFLSVDPITKKYPMLTPYQFASNSPISGLDRDGLEYLTFHTSMYSMQAKTFVINYENIPSQIQNPMTHSFIAVSGGPVTTYGRDYDSQLDGTIYYDADRYYKHADFYNLPATAVPEPTASAKGNVIPGSHGTEGREANLGAGASALGESGAGYFANLWNYLSPLSVQAGLIQEQKLRAGFFNARNAVAAKVDFKTDMLKAVQGASHVNSDALINFVTDGTLNYKTNSMKSIIGALQTAYYGAQILRNNHVEIQNKTKNAISELISKYKSKGGSNDFDKISDYYKPKDK